MRGKRLISFLCAAAMTVSAFAGLTVTASAQGTDSYALAAAETHEVTITPDSSGAAKVLVNTTETTPLSGVLIHATYTADNKLESVEAKDFTIADAAGVNVDLKKAYSVGDKIFVWNSLSGMVPYKADVIILIPTETGAPAYNATGKVVDKDGNPLAGAEITVSVPDGEDVVVTADSEGNYTIPELPAGNYQVVVEYTPDGGETQTVTEALEITDKDVDKTITLPDANVNSALVVEEDTPDVIVDGLTDTAIDEAKDEGEKKVTVTMTVARQPEDLTDPEQKAIKDIATEEETIEYLDISLIKTVEDETGEKTDEEIDETAKAITLAVAMDTTDKHDIVVYRYHDGVATALSQTPVDGEYYEVTDDFVKIHANKFSVYAIAYKTGAAPVVTDTPVQTETPVVTDTPVQTEAPVVTDTPTEAPTVVPTTAVTTAPTTAPTVVPTTAVTTAPSGTEAPVVRPTSRPTSDIKTVAITGTAAVGETLKANVTPAEAQTGVAYQWSYSDDGETYTDIAGATSDTFTIPATVPAENEEDEDIPLLGKTLKVTVTVPETNLNFTGGPLEAETKAIVNAAISGTIEIAGEGNIGKVLTATVTGVPEGSKIEWQYNDGTGYKELVAAADVTVPALSATPTPEETAQNEADKKAVEAAKQYTIASPLKAGDKIRAVIKSDSKSGQIESNEITVLSATSGKIAKSSTTDATLTGTAPTAITAATNLTAEGTDVENNGVITLEGDLDYRNFPGFSGIQSEQFGYYTAYDIIFPSNFDNENGVVVLTGSTDKTVTAANFDGTDKDRLTIIKHLTAAKVQANPTEKVELYNTADTSGTPVYTYNIDFTELSLYAKVTSSAPISDVSAAKAEADDTVTFKVTPTTGRLKAGSVAVKSGDDDITFTEEDGVYSFTMPDKDVTISAETESIPSSKITFTSTAFGSVTVNAGRNLATGEQVASGTTVTVNAQPAGDAYELTSLTVGGESVTPENGVYSFTMGDEAVEINAAFARKTIDSIEIKGDDLVKKGKTAPYTVVVTAVDGTDITSAVENNEVSWTKTGIAEGTLSSTAGKSINLTVGANEETASGALIILTASIPGTSATDRKTVTPVDADTYPINISATNATVTTDPNGSQVGKGVVTVTVEPDLGYVLTNSSVAVKNSDTGDEIEYEGEDGTYTFTMPEDKGATITVSTTAIQYDIVVASADNGSASVYPTKPAGVKYTAADIESKVKVYPIADTGYEVAGIYVGNPEDEYELTDKDTDGGYIISLEDLVEGSVDGVLTITPVFEAKKNTVKIVGNTDAVSYKTNKGDDTEVEVAYGDTFTLVPTVDATAEEALEEGYPTVTYVDANGATQTLEPATGGVYTMPDADVTVTVKTVTKSYEVVVTYDPDAFNGNDGSIKLRVWDAEKEDFVGNSIAGETDTEANTVTFDVPAGTYKVVFTDALNDNYIDPVAETEPVTVSAAAATASLTATATRQYVVTFDADGGTFADASGSTTEPKVIKVNIDETFTDNVPDEPEKDNYHFEGWKKVDAETDEVTGDNIDFDTETVEEDTTYRAVWTKVSGITVNVPANKGESTIEIYDGDTKLEGTGLRNVKEGTTITVVIIPDTANNYTYEPDTISVKETVSEEAVETTEVEDNSAIKYNFEMPGESVTVTANFYDPVKVTFNYDGGTDSDGEESAVVSLDYNASLTAGDIPEPTKDNHRFLGWVDDADEENTLIEEISTTDKYTENTSYTAQYVERYTVTLPTTDDFENGTLSIVYTDEDGDEQTVTPDATAVEIVVDKGTELAITATPEKDDTTGAKKLYKVKSLTANEDDIDFEEGENNVATATYEVNADAELAIEFEYDPNVTIGVDATYVNFLSDYADTDYREQTSWKSGQITIDAGAFKVGNQYEDTNVVTLFSFDASDYVGRIDKVILKFDALTDGGNNTYGALGKASTYIDIKNTELTANNINSQGATFSLVTDSSKQWGDAFFSTEKNKTLNASEEIQQYLINEIFPDGTGKVTLFLRTGTGRETTFSNFSVELVTTEENIPATEVTVHKVYEDEDGTIEIGDKKYTEIGTAEAETGTYYPGQTFTIAADDYKTFDADDGSARYVYVSGAGNVTLEENEDNKNDLYVIYKKFDYTTTTFNITLADANATSTEAVTVPIVITGTIDAGAEPAAAYAGETVNVTIAQGATTGSATTAAKLLPGTYTYNIKNVKDKYLGVKNGEVVVGENDITLAVNNLEPAAVKAHVYETGTTTKIAEDVTIDDNLSASDSFDLADYLDEGVLDEVLTSDTDSTTHTFNRYTLRDDNDATIAELEAGDNFISVYYDVDKKNDEAINYYYYNDFDADGASFDDLASTGNGRNYSYSQFGRQGTIAVADGGIVFTPSLNDGNNTRTEGGYLGFKTPYTTYTQSNKYTIDYDWTVTVDQSNGNHPNYDYYFELINSADHVLLGMWYNKGITKVFTGGDNGLKVKSDSVTDNKRANAEGTKGTNAADAVTIDSSAGTTTVTYHINIAVDQGAGKETYTISKDGTVLKTDTVDTDKGANPTGIYMFGTNRASHYAGTQTYDNFNIQWDGVITNTLTLTGTETSGVYAAGDGSYTAKIGTGENITGGSADAPLASTVTITPATVQGKVAKVTATGDVTPERQEDGTWTFTMPNNSVTVTVTYEDPAVDKIEVVPVTATDVVVNKTDADQTIALTAKFYEGENDITDDLTDAQKVLTYSVASNTAGVEAAADATTGVKVTAGTQAAPEKVTVTATSTVFTDVAEASRQGIIRIDPELVEVDGTTTRIYVKADSQSALGGGADSALKSDSTQKFSSGAAAPEIQINSGNTRSGTNQYGGRGELTFAIPTGLDLSEKTVTLKVPAGYGYQGQASSETRKMKLKVGSITSTEQMEWVNATQANAVESGLLFTLDLSTLKENITAGSDYKVTIVGDTAISASVLTREYFGTWGTEGKDCRGAYLEIADAE